MATIPGANGTTWLVVPAATSILLGNRLTQESATGRYAIDAVQL